ncbi:MAG: DUF503 domain-containing protein [Gemmataceae bacterium]|nr:DUF503 domain-containing protein [Gemmataceae bacterium]
MPGLKINPVDSNQGWGKGFGSRTGPKAGRKTKDVTAASATSGQEVLKLTLPMQVGSLRVRLLLRQAQSLKDKRQVVRSILERLRNSFLVAATEVESQDDHKVVVLGIAAVADEVEAVQKVLEQVKNALRGHPVAEFVSAESEVLSPMF